MGAAVGTALSAFLSTGFVVLLIGTLLYFLTRTLRRARLTFIVTCGVLTAFFMLARSALHETCCIVIRTEIVRGGYPGYITKPRFMFWEATGGKLRLYPAPSHVQEELGREWARLRKDVWNCKAYIRDHRLGLSEFFAGVEEDALLTGDKVILLTGITTVWLLVGIAGLRREAPLSNGVTRLTVVVCVSLAGAVVSILARRCSQVDYVGPNNMMEWGLTGGALAAAASGAVVLFTRAVRHGGRETESTQSLSLRRAPRANSDGHSSTGVPENRPGAPRDGGPDIKPGSFS